MIPYYKKDAGRWCQEPKCKKRRTLGDTIDYVIYGSTFCKIHAQKKCTEYNISLPNSTPRSEKEQEIIDFLRSNLQLAIKHTGGCPEENSPADRDLYLILDGEVIAEVSLSN